MKARCWLKCRLVVVAVVLCAPGCLYYAVDTLSQRSGRMEGHWEYTSRSSKGECYTDSEAIFSLLGNTIHLEKADPGSDFMYTNDLEWVISSATDGGSSSSCSFNLSVLRSTAYVASNSTCQNGMFYALSIRPVNGTLELSDDGDTLKMRSMEFELGVSYYGNTAGTCTQTMDGELRRR